MKKYAVLNDNSIVENIILAPSLEIAEATTYSHCILIPLNTFVDIGFLYADGEFSAPVEETPAEETPAEETPA
jgi:hypothetical protein